MWWWTCLNFTPYAAENGGGDVQPPLPPRKRLMRCARHTLGPETAVLEHNFGSSGHPTCQRLVCRDGSGGGTWDIALVVGPFSSEAESVAFERRAAELVGGGGDADDTYVTHIVTVASGMGLPCYTRRVPTTPDDECRMLQVADPRIAAIYMDMYKRRCEQMCC